MRDGGDIAFPNRAVYTVSNLGMVVDIVNGIDDQAGNERRTQIDG